MLLSTVPLRKPKILHCIAPVYADSEIASIASYIHTDGEKVDDHNRYCAGSGNAICQVWACCQACLS
ncbi:hypothetical protein HanXRQr2_Chr01g0032581 [Helianthus annuus]|uniref:Uncharacterized protein n=1 Tax=Helianthus annuus TaxID=4232 RepID=A0A9K3JY88_HELAN|nr:hypothetical protein HanXRQr2_Chr01g0032581 [Helianthus annuus]KAJ0957794.1 hypothetical protein HanPSC8_Chr01g0031771 [Helianthus annuus]